MKIFTNENMTEKIITIFYFTIALVEFVAEFFMYKPVLLVVKPLVLVVLMWLYWCTSTQRNLLFFVLFSFLMITKIYIIFDSEEMLFLAMMAFLLHRLIMIYYIITKLIKIKDYIPLFIVMIPFLFFFLYLLTQTSDITVGSYYALILQSVLIAVLASITISQYVMDSDKKGLWLLIFGLVSVMQYFIVFIDRIYLEGSSPMVFKPLLVILTTSACFTFYKFVITTEKLNNN